MPNKLILSSRRMKIAAAKAEMSLREVNDAAGFGPNYIYRIGDTDGVLLTTVNRIAAALGCDSAELLEPVEMEEEMQPDTQHVALAVAA